jgi:hypothetical protein
MACLGKWRPGESTAVTRQESPRTFREHADAESHESTLAHPHLEQWVAVQRDLNGLDVKQPTDEVYWYVVGYWLKHWRPALVTTGQARLLAIIDAPEGAWCRANLFDIMADCSRRMCRP